ncbi:MAG: hypothetical protein V4525_07850 [Pseudomonadota bacterium]
MKKTWHRDELIQLLSISATLAGLNITSVTVFHTFGKTSKTITIADDILAIDALLFLLCTYTIFFALRTKNKSLAIIAEKVSDVIFFLALTGMVFAGFIMVYTIW